MKIKAKCLTFDSNDSKGAAYTSDGYMLPCCWLDDPQVLRYLKKSGLKDPKLSVENNDNLEEIFGSDAWENFFQKLVNDPDNCSYICKKKCGIELTDNDIEIRKAEERLEVVRQIGGK